MTTPRKTPPRFLNSSEVEDAIFEVAELAKRSRVHVALAGGCAMQLSGSDRFTKDVDFVASGRIAGLKTKDRLTFGGIQSMTSAGTPVDIILRDDGYQDLYDAALDTARRVRGVGVPVVRLEYLAAMKLQAGRGKDIQDLEFILLDSDVNYKKARAIVDDYLGPYAADELDNIRDTAAWERTRGQK